MYRPWTPQPGEHLLIDFGKVTSGPNEGLLLFTAVLAWSRWRFVRFCRDETLETTLRLLAECFETAGGVPAVVLADRMGCLKGGVVANVVVPTAAYVRFAAHYGFRPDFCEAADPESKGAVEALVRYSKSDLVVPADDFGGDLAVANDAAVAWCGEVNAVKHSETQAVPQERLAVERDVLRTLPSLRVSTRRGVMRKVDKMSTVRIGSARYSGRPLADREDRRRSPGSPAPRPRPHHLTMQPSVINPLRGMAHCTIPVRPPTTGGS